jgi:hypothetical protein
VNQIQGFVMRMEPLMEALVMVLVRLFRMRHSDVAFLLATSGFARLPSARSQALRSTDGLDADLARAAANSIALALAGSDAGARLFHESARWR